MQGKSRWLALPLIAAVVGALAVASTAGAAGGSASKACGNGKAITVWVDSVRLPEAKGFAAAYPKCKVNIVTFDGDSNGATTLQAKIQLWNRSGGGWPDVIFSEQVNDPIWMSEKPFSYAANLAKLIPKSILSQWPKPSTLQCTVNGVQVCVQDNIAPDVLWYNATLMKQFGYTVPTTWQQWAAIGADVAQHHPGYVIGSSGDSYGAWIYFWANQCPLEHFLNGGKTLEINAANVHCTEMATLLDPLIKSGVLPPETVFAADFAKTYGGTADKVLMMPGPAWYAESLFNATLHLPSGQIAAAAPLSWNGQQPVTTGQIGGGPWVISKHAKNSALAANFVIYEITKFDPLPTTLPTARPGYPGYAPLAKTWLTSLAKDTYFASDPTPALKTAANEIWHGWDLVTYPDQPVWSNSVVTGLVNGQTLTSLLPTFQQGLSQAAQAAGYKVSNS